MNLQSVIQEELKKEGKKIALVNSKDLGDNWSPEFHTYRVQGKKPYLKLGFKFQPSTKNHELKKCVYMTDKDANLLNALGSGIEDLKKKFDDEQRRIFGSQPNARV